MPRDIKYKNNYIISEETGIGDIKVSTEVVMAIAAVAATEVKGVYEMQGNATHELVTMLGMKNLSQGVAIDIEDNVATIGLSVVLNYGYSIPKVSATIQEKVKNSVETMTGLEVETVNVRIAGVHIDKDQ